MLNRNYIKMHLNIESDLINTLFNELVTNHTILPYIYIVLADFTHHCVRVSIPQSSLYSLFFLVYAICRQVTYFVNILSVFSIFRGELISDMRWGFVLKLTASVMLSNAVYDRITKDQNNTLVWTLTLWNENY